MELAGAICKATGRLALEKMSLDDNVVSVGGVTYASTPNLSQLLAEADIALSAARTKGTNSWEVLPLSVQEAGSEIKGRNWWRDTLAQVMEKRAIELYGQMMVNLRDRQPFCLELLSRITLEGGELVSAGVFVPLAERLQMISRFDRIMLEKTFAVIRQLPVDRVAVNLSSASLADPAFTSWVVEELRGAQQSGVASLVFEFSEYAAVQYLEVVRDFAVQVEQLGHAIALDDFGQSFANFGYLKSLRPQYVKIDRPLILQLENEESDAHFYVRALCGVAHSLGIKVIAEAIEREEQLAIIEEVGIDGFQGYLLGRPEPL
jgi:EAL domain-containing protein (putative c-di-GMP-specific phosphodiesterase class I)